MNHIEFVPVMVGNVQVGSARVFENGEIEFTIVPNQATAELFSRLTMGHAFGMSLGPVSEPSVAGPYNNQIRYRNRF